MQANASIAMWKTGVEEVACKALAMLLFPALVVPCRTMAVGDDITAAYLERRTTTAVKLEPRSDQHSR